MAPARVRPWLSPFSWVYRAGVALRNRAFDSGVLIVTRLGVPVIAVGNIVTGGVGKTPLVQYIAGYCAAKGRKVGVVSRGYKRNSVGVIDVSNGAGTVVNPAEGGDEAVQVAQALPEAIVVVGERRVEAARRAMVLGADVIIADDGYQHRYLGRDLNILVLDSRVNLRHEALLPAGRMREPLTAVNRADIIALSHTIPGENPEWLVPLIGSYPRMLVRFRYRTLRSRSALTHAEISTESQRSVKVIAFSGIGNHGRFLETARSAGYEIGGDMRFEDHHSYSDNDFHRLGTLMEETGSQTCITTEKDVIRIGTENPVALRFFRERNVLYIPVAIEFTEGGHLFHRKIDDCLNRTP